MSYDTDAQAYITAVESADTQALELGVKNAINAFVVGCKADGIWSAIKASCIMAGARTRLGAMTPLVGPAPTSFNFVDADYDRKTGLVGDGSSRRLGSNRAADLQPVDSYHLSAWQTVGSTISGASTSLLGDTSGATTGATIIAFSAAGGNAFLGRNRNSSAQTHSTANRLTTGFFGNNRSSGSGFELRAGGSTQSFSLSSQTPSPTRTVGVFARDTSFLTNARLSWYSIGESLDLALLDARLATLMTALGDDATYATSSLRRNHAFIGVAF
jgi:hypothetical protein